MTISPREVTIVLAIPSQFVTAAPYMEELRNEGYVLHVFCPSRMHNLVRSSGLATQDVVHDLDPIQQRYATLSRIHQALILGLTRPDFSPYFRRVSAGETLARSGPRKVLAALRPILPKLDAPQVNSIAQRLIKSRKSPFPTSVVIVLSKTLVPHLLATDDLSTVTIADSWDHSIGVPQGYVSDLVVAWNGDLARDWAVDQGWPNAVVGFPMRLRYAYEAELRTGDLGSWLYPFGSSPSSRFRDWFEEEQQVVEGIRRAATRMGARLLLKPHPAGPPGHLDHFAEGNAHVSIGRYGSNLDAGSASYTLDNEYNENRLLELEACGLVFNLWTTFGLDAAMAKRPVCQLDLREAQGLPAIRDALQGLHLRRYLFGTSPEAVLEWDGSSDLGSRLRDRYALGNASRYSSTLRDWLTPHSPREAVLHVTRAVESLVRS